MKVEAKKTLSGVQSPLLSLNGPVDFRNVYEVAWEVNHSPNPTLFVLYFYGYPGEGKASRLGLTGIWFFSNMQELRSALQDISVDHPHIGMRRRGSSAA